MHEPHRNYNPNRGDPNAPTNPRLLNAMNMVARNDNPDTRQALYKAILEANFVLPLPEAPDGHPGGLVDIDAASPLNLVLLQDLNGRVVLPAFTDTTALLAWDQAVPAYVAFPAPMLFQAANNEQIQAIVVNVAGPTGGEISASEIAILAQGALPQPDNSYAFPEDTELIIRYPENLPPDALLSMLHSGLKAQPGIESAYLVDVIFPDGEAHLLVAVAFSTLPNEATLSIAMQDLIMSVQPAVQPELRLDFMVLMPDNDDAVSAAVREHGLIIFRRSEQA